MIGTQIPRAAYATEQDLREASPALLLELLLELRKEYNVVAKIRNDYATTNGRLVTKLHAIRQAVQNVDE